MAKTAVLWDRSIPWSEWTLLAYLWQDVALVLGFAAVEFILGRRTPRARVTSLLYWLCVVYVVVNIPIGIVLSTPLTWSMLRATSGTLADSILLYATLPHVAIVVLTLVAAAAMPRLVVGIPRSLAISLTAVAVACLGAGPYAQRRVDTHGLHRNAVLALVATTLPRAVEGSSLEDWARPPFELPPADDLTALRGIAAGRNVIVVTLESTGAGYLRAYGGEHDITPNLDRLAAHGVVFDHAYAVYPESIKGLFTIICSRYPVFDTSAETLARGQCRSVAHEFGRAGYRTALFHSGRFAYLGMNAIIRGRGFDTLEDAAAIGGDHESSFGVDEASTVARMLEWIDRGDTGRPFFLHYMPIAGHHPYETPERGPLPTRHERDRYLNALHYADQSLGSLVSGLDRRGLLEKTAFVIFGDHGEAFGQHAGNYGHTFFLYEENVRVPFVISVPGAIDKPRRSRSAVSLVDAAPTLLDLLQLPVPSDYQGRSALTADPRMTMFFTDYSLGLLGLRDGRWKYIYEVEGRRSKLFDLERDPHERVDLAAMNGPRVRAYEQAVRAWIGTAGL